MQRKALKQLGKVTQWTNEKVFSGEKTQLSDDFTDFERDVDVRRIGIERLHATSIPFYEQLTKRKPTADPYPQSGSGKDKILLTEALGLVMIDYGGDVGGTYGDGLSKYGRARCKLAIAQEEYGERLNDGYISGMHIALESVNDYKTFRKKLDSRRLALDSAISKVQNSKKESRQAEMDVEEARERFEEIEEETKARLVVIQEQEARQWDELADLLDAELEYFTKCKSILEDLRDSWPSGEITSSSANRPRAKSNASARSLNRQATTRNMRRASSDEEDAPTPNRSRSDSNTSSHGGSRARRMLPSFGSFGKKSAMANLGGGTTKRKSFGANKEKERYDDDSRQALHSDDEEEEPRSPISASTTGRNRSQTTLSASRVSLASDGYGAPPPMRRTHTTPVRGDGHYVKALYDYAGGAADELTIRAGEIIEVKKEVSADWWIGECSGRSGLFPSAYCEEYVPSPVTAKPAPRAIPPPPGGARNIARSMPPAPSTLAPSSPGDRWASATSESEADHGFSDAEHNATASLTGGGQAPSSYKSGAPPASSGRKPPPPPPPSRRTQSSSNLLSTFANATLLSPPQPAYLRQNNSHGSNEGSPFAGSEGEDDDEEEIFGGRSRNATVGASSAPSAGPGGGLASGLGNMHLGRGGGGSGDAPDCGTCGCEDFTQNVFKSPGICSTCFHQH